MSLTLAYQSFPDSGKRDFCRAVAEALVPVVGNIKPWGKPAALDASRTHLYNGFQSTEPLHFRIWFKNWSGEHKEGPRIFCAQYRGREKGWRYFSYGISRFTTVGDVVGAVTRWLSGGTSRRLGPLRPKVVEDATQTT